jgi:hypothetical protein
MDARKQDRDMNDELDRHVHRWLAADDEDRDDDAEAAFRVVFTSAAESMPVPAGFTADTMRAVERVAARDRKAARLTRLAAIWLGVAGGLTLAYFSAGAIASTLTLAFGALLDFAISVIVGAATNGQSGTSVWTVFGNLGRAAAAFAASPTVTITILTIQAIAIAALVALQRILGSDLE